MYPLQVEDNNLSLKESILYPKIIDIKAQIDEMVWIRGEAYADTSAVVELKEIDENTIHSVVEGEFSYNVEIKKEKSTLECSCNCPYDGICKHIVATLIKFS